MYLYHATFEAYLHGSTEKGLIPDGQKTWPDCATGFVYLSSDMSGAISFCETAEDVSSNVYDSGICCFEVDAALLDTSLLSDDPNMIWAPDEEPWCFVYAGRIPYEALRLCWTEEKGEIKRSLDSQIQSASLRSEDPGTRTTLPERSI